jgi:hypothetical protein
MPMNPLIGKKDLVVMLMEGLKKGAKGKDDEAEVEPFDPGEEPAEDDYDTAKDAQITAARSVRTAFDNGSDEALAKALKAFVDACN